MEFIITTDISDCVKEDFVFISFGSNCYTDRIATLTYISEDETEERHYSKKANPAFIAKQIVSWGLSAPFLACEPQLVNGVESNQQALDFYNAVRTAILSIGTYKVAVAVTITPVYNPVTEKHDTYIYTPFFLRSSYSNREALVMTLPVETDYNNLLTSNTVSKYVDQFRLAHQKSLEEKALAALQAELAYEQGRTQAVDLLIGATFIALSGNTLRFLSTNGTEFSVYASMTSYDECALIVGNNEI